VTEGVTSPVTGTVTTQQLDYARDDNAKTREVLAGERRRLAATKGANTKLRKRAKHGVCVVAGCTRTFSNAAHHMRTEHPDYKPEDEE